MAAELKWARAVRWVGWGLLGGVTFLEVFTMGDAGLSKFQNQEGWMYWFARFGYPPLLAPVVGGLEFVGADFGDPPAAGR